MWREKVVTVSAPLSCCLTDILRIPGPFGRDLPSLRAQRQQNSIAATPLTAKFPDTGRRGTGTGRFAFIKAHLRCRCLSHVIRSPGHAGAGGARRRAISDRMSWNICRDTATSASWKVTYRPWLTTLALKRKVAGLNTDCADMAEVWFRPRITVGAESTGVASGRCRNRKWP
jgi:hypothetical protein